MLLCLGRLWFNHRKEVPILQENIESPELPESGTGSGRARTASARSFSIRTFSRTWRDLFLLTPRFLCLPFGPVAAVAAPHPQPDWFLFFVQG